MIAYIVLGALALAALVWWLAGNARSQAPSPVVHAKRPNPSVASFGPKCGWLAIRSTDSAAVLRALGGDEERTVTFGDGVDAAYQAYFFITPPIDGWTLVASAELLFTFEVGDTSVDEPIAALSKRLDTTVYFFGTHRVAETHGYLVFERGERVRAYVWTGESGRVMRDEGARQAFEIARGIGLDQSTLEAAWDADAQVAVLNERALLEISGELSINPAELESRGPMPDGWVRSRVLSLARVEP